MSGPGQTDATGHDIRAAILARPADFETSRRRYRYVLPADILFARCWRNCGVRCFCARSAVNPYGASSTARIFAANPA